MKLRSMFRPERFIPLLILLFFALIYIFPLLVMFTTSFKTNDEAFDSAIGLFPPSFYLGNYERALTIIPFARYFLNTCWISLMCILGVSISTPMVAYSLSKIRWVGRDVIFTIITATMLIPYTVTMLPIYRMWSKISLVGTFWPLIIPSFFGYPFYIIILRQFMLTLPNELLEAAKIDGCNAWQRFSRIVLPLTKPGMATIIIFSFMHSFSDFLGPLLYANRADHYTLALGLQAFFSEHFIDWTGLMAAVTMFIIPILIVFLLGQRQFVEGISTSGIKG